MKRTNCIRRVAGWNQFSRCTLFHIKCTIAFVFEKCQLQHTRTIIMCNGKKSWGNLLLAIRHLDNSNANFTQGGIEQPPSLALSPPPPHPLPDSVFATNLACNVCEMHFYATVTSLKIPANGFCWFILFLPQLQCYC